MHRIFYDHSLVYSLDLSVPWFASCVYALCLFAMTTLLDYALDLSIFSWRIHLNMYSTPPVSDSASHNTDLDLERLADRKARSQSE